MLFTSRHHFENHDNRQRRPLSIHSKLCFAFHWRHSYRISSQLNPTPSSPFTSGLASLARGGGCIACWISFMRPMNPWRLRPTLSARSRRILKTRLLFSAIEGWEGWNWPLKSNWVVTLSCWKFWIAWLARWRLASSRMVFVWRNVKGRKIVTKDEIERDAHDEGHCGKC